MTKTFHIMIVCIFLCNTFLWGQEQNQEQIQDIVKELISETVSEQLQEMRHNQQSQFDHQSESESVTKEEKESYAAAGKEWEEKIVYVVKEVAASLYEGVDLTADKVVEFSKTPLGIATIAIIIWKMIGTTIMQIISAIIFLLMFFVIAYKGYVYIYKGQKILLSKEGRKKTYQYLEPLSEKMKTARKNVFDETIYETAFYPLVFVWIIVMIFIFIGLLISIVSFCS